MNRKVRDFVSCLVKGWGVQDKISPPTKNRNRLNFLVRLEYPETRQWQQWEQNTQDEDKQKKRKKQRNLNR
jgi:hypothetical protein